MGASRGVFDPEIIRGDIEAVIVALKRPMPEPLQESLPGPPEVDPGKCTDVPHLRAFMSARGHQLQQTRRGGRRHLHSLRHLRGRMSHGSNKAGACFTTTRDVLTHQGLLAHTGATRKIAAFLCSRSAADAMESIGRQIGENLVPIPVPCAGTVGLTHVLSAFESGADGVIVAGCFKGNCASIYGTLLAEDRVAQVGDS